MEGGGARGVRFSDEGVFALVAWLKFTSFPGRLLRRRRVLLLPTSDNAFRRLPPVLRTYSPAACRH